MAGPDDSDRDDRDGRDEILVDNGARQLTLDELGRSQPGMGRLMPEVGARTWKAWYRPRPGTGVWPGGS